MGRLRQRVYLIESEGRRWHIVSFDLPVSITNGGARSGQVLGMRLRLQFPDLPIPGHFELVPATFELPPEQARLIDSNRFEWLKSLTISDWLPFTVLPRSSAARHFIFETRWDEPVIQEHVSVAVELRNSVDQEWSTVGTFELHIGNWAWAEMTGGGSSFSCRPCGQEEPGQLMYPPDLHKYIGVKGSLPAAPSAPSSRQVLPKR